MISKWIKIVLSLLMAVVIIGGTFWQVKFNKDWRAEYAYAKGIDAMVYAFPYYLNSFLLYKADMPYQKEISATGMVNKFRHSFELVNPKQYRDGGSPNRDTLYSASLIHAKAEPIILTVPPIPNDRYYTFEMAGFDSDNFAYVGKRTHGNKGGNYAIVPPGWKGVLPDDVEFLAENPTSWFLILGRTLVNPNDPQDEARVNALQKQYKIVALSDWGKGDWNKQTPPVPQHPAVNDLGELSHMIASGVSMVDFIKKMVISDPMSFWRVVNHAMTVNGVPARDQNHFYDWAKLHIGPNQDITKLSDSERDGLSRATLDGLLMMKDFSEGAYDAKQVNGWRYLDSALGRAGHKGAYMTRGALQSLKGIVANDAEESVYLVMKKDEHDEVLNGESNYQIHFEAAQLPNVKEFWSLTLYDKEGNLVLNPIDRYSLSDRSEGLVYGSDGSLTIHVGQNTPASNDTNWLPVDGEDFTLILRAYGPGQEIIAQTWQPPNVRKI